MPPAGGRGPRINDITPPPLPRAARRARSGLPTRRAFREVGIVARAYDAIVIGGGHNGLTTAAYLAQAGKKVVVLERRHVLGGAAVTEEVYPGFKFTVCSYVCSLLRPQIIRDLDLPSHGFEVIPQESSFLPPPDVGSLNPSELRKLLVLNKQVQTLTEDELYTFARLMTMSAADYLDEWFETDVVNASLCSSGIIGTMLGPRSL